ncbi:MAG: hypothetical protein ABI459_05775 [Deltaproteobacteria bacterium]
MSAPVKFFTAMAAALLPNIALCEVIFDATIYDQRDQPSLEDIQHSSFGRGGEYFFMPKKAFSVCMDCGQSLPLVGFFGPQALVSVIDFEERSPVQDQFLRDRTHAIYSQFMSCGEPADAP